MSHSVTTAGYTAAEIGDISAFVYPVTLRYGCVSVRSTG